MWVLWGMRQFDLFNEKEPLAGVAEEVEGEEQASMDLLMRLAPTRSDPWVEGQK